MQPTWQTPDGSIRLYHADCRDVLPGLVGIDAVITDPPYDLDIAQGDKGCFAESYSKLTSRPLQAIADSFDIPETVKQWAALEVHTVFCFCSNAQVPELMLSFRDVGMSPTLLCWHKYNSVPFSFGTWRQDAEWCIHAKRPGAPLNGDAEKKRKVKQHPLCTEFPDHPTAKPLAVVRDYVEIGTNEGQTILDPYMGSGTTGIVAASVGRRFVGIEKDAGYFEAAQGRIQTALSCPLFDEPTYVQKSLLTPTPGRE